MAKRRSSRGKFTSLTIGEVSQRLSGLAPESAAETWDNVGLLVGDPHWKTSAAVVSVDLTLEAIAAAKKSGARLIVNHHPCIFPRQHGLSRLTPSSLAFQAAREGIAVYASHTNFDRCALEVPRHLSQLLGVQIQGRLMDRPREALKKLVVFVPVSHADRVHEALGSASAGHVGNYDQCAFLSEGEGRFRGGASTKPFLGTPGRTERAREIRLETVFPAGMETVVLQALRQSHPYEEIAYDLYSVEQPASAEGMVAGLGYGFFGALERPMQLGEFGRKLGGVFGASGAILTPATGVRPSQQRVRRMAFVAGKGSGFIAAAASAGCDLFVTGETGYHDALSASRRGMTVIELGHRESERFYLKVMSEWLAEMGLRIAELNVPIQEVVSFAGKLRR